MRNAILHASAHAKARQVIKQKQMKTMGRRTKLRDTRIRTLQEHNPCRSKEEERNPTQTQTPEEHMINLETQEMKTKEYTKCEKEYGELGYVENKTQCKTGRRQKMEMRKKQLHKRK